MDNIYEYKYPHHAVTTDSVVFGFDGRELQLLLVERGLEPYKGCWALPGGFLRPEETVEQCAKRELREETGVENVYLEQFHVFSSVDRDPRERVITVAFVVLVKKSDYKLIANDDAVRASWFLTGELPPLAFDHYKIIKRARKHLRTMLRERPIVFKLLDKKFSITELQRLYEIINDTKYDRRNFARKITSSGLLREEGVSSESSHNRFPNLYSFDEEGYNEMMADDDVQEAEADVEDLPVANDYSRVIQHESSTPVIECMYKRVDGPVRQSPLREAAMMDDDFLKMYSEYRQMKMEKKIQKRVAKKKKPRNPFDI